mmetsp:Transcript_4823/g.5291  ORF Transcript_4823/g.5291 Transcript_4823/m.5291 type:complete len:203 (+) Transcript_4823:6954-7562(+)
MRQRTAAVCSSSKRIPLDKITFRKVSAELEACGPYSSRIAATDIRCLGNSEIFEAIPMSRLETVFKRGTRFKPIAGVPKSIKNDPAPSEDRNSSSFCMMLIRPCLISSEVSGICELDRTSESLDLRHFLAETCNTLFWEKIRQYARDINSEEVKLDHLAKIRRISSAELKAKVSNLRYVSNREETFVTAPFLFRISLSSFRN